MEFKTEVVVGEGGHIEIDHAPFAKGQTVEVSVTKAPEPALTYDQWKIRFDEFCSRAREITRGIPPLPIEALSRESIYD